MLSLCLVTRLSGLGQGGAIAIEYAFCICSWRSFKGIRHTDGNTERLQMYEKRCF